MPKERRVWTREKGIPSLSLSSIRCIWTKRAALPHSEVITPCKTSWIKSEDAVKRMQAHPRKPDQPFLKCWAAYLRVLALRDQQQRPHLRWLLASAVRGHWHGDVASLDTVCDTFVVRLASAARFHRPQLFFCVVVCARLCPLAAHSIRLNFDSCSVLPRFNTVLHTHILWLGTPASPPLPQLREARASLGRYAQKLHMGGDELTGDKLATTLLGLVPGNVRRAVFVPIPPPTRPPAA